MKKLFKLNVTKNTGQALVLGGVMILLSILMLFFDGSSLLDTCMSVLLRDILMIFVLGFCYVTYACEKRGAEAWEKLGITKNKIIPSLILNFVFGLMLLFSFVKDGVPEHLLYVENFYAAVYIMVAGIFEMLFIYGFLRMEFEEAFGIIPAIILTAVFYSFHHAGFQPEFFKLFFVGIMYVAVFYITHNIFVIFPFFWGVGALWDVLVNSVAGEGIKNFFSFMIAIIVLCCMIVWSLLLKRRRGNAI